MPCAGPVERQPAVRSNRTNYGDVLACACLFRLWRCRAPRPARCARRAARRDNTALGSRSAHAPRDAAHMTDVRRHRARPQGQASARPPTAGQGCARPGAAPALSVRSPRGVVPGAGRVGSCPRPTGPHRARHARRQPAPTEVKHPQQQTRRDARGGALTALAEPIAVLALHDSSASGCSPRASISSRKHTRESGGVRYT